MRGRACVLAALAAGAALAVAPAEARGADVSAEVSRQRLLVSSRGADARITLRLRAGRPSQLVVDADSDGDAEFRFDRARFDRILVNARGGNDVVRIVERNGRFTTTERTTIRGGPGRDSLAGGSGSETLIGGPDADAIVGGPGADHVSLGPGDDLFRTAAGDGRDVLEGQDGIDALRVAGSPVTDAFALTATGARLRLERNGNPRAVDAAGVERVDARPAGGSDTLTVDDLSGTDATSVLVDLGPADGRVDHVVANGTSGDDVATVSSNPPGVTLAGLPAAVSISNSAPDDTLRVNVLAGDDVIEGSGLAAGALLLTLDGGDGADVLIGGAGPDIAFGGAGDDVLIGGPGLDVLDGGPGDNIVIQD